MAETPPVAFAFAFALCLSRLFLEKMQHEIPAHIAGCARSLYRECLRRAYYLGGQQGNRDVLIAMVRQQFKRNMHESDPQKIEERKQAAARALFNHMYYEAQRMAAQHAEDALIKEQLLGLPNLVIGKTLDDNADQASRWN